MSDCLAPVDQPRAAQLASSRLVKSSSDIAFTYRSNASAAASLRSELENGGQPGGRRVAAEAVELAKTIDVDGSYGV